MMNGKEKNVGRSSHNIKVNVMHVAGPWSKSLPGYKKHAMAWSGAALKEGKGKLLSIVFADDAFTRDLNHTYRGKNKATNVLAFPGDGEELGDIVLAYETLKREAGEQGKSFRGHAAHLIVHGCLHLLGHDHKKAKDAKAMEALEIKILATLGFANPYELRH